MRDSRDGMTRDLRSEILTIYEGIGMPMGMPRIVFILIVLVSAAYLAWRSIPSSSIPKISLPGSSSSAPANSPSNANGNVSAPGPNPETELGDSPEVYLPESLPGSGIILPPKTKIGDAVPSPPGIFFLKERVSVMKKDGVIAAVPGEKLTRLERLSNGKMKLTNGSNDFVVSESQVTDDLVAARLAEMRFKATGR